MYKPDVLLFVMTNYRKNETTEHCAACILQNRIRYDKLQLLTKTSHT